MVTWGRRQGQGQLGLVPGIIGSVDMFKEYEDVLEKRNAHVMV